MKQKIVASINFLIGGFGILIVSTYYLFLRPKILNMYAELGEQMPNNLSLYLWSLIILVALNLFFGLKLISKKSPLKTKYINLVAIFTIASFVLLGLFTQKIVFETISPVYDISQNLN